MGKSDPHVFDLYSQLLPKKTYNNVAFLGFSGPSPFTDSIQSFKKDFYDMSLSNWDINSKDWEIEKKYDLVVSTRCPYFAKDPRNFIEKSIDLLVAGGFFLADWGLGDHWRYENFKIGWVKNGEHESFYKDDNYLQSFVWHSALNSSPEFLDFKENVKKLGYEDVEKAMEDEVPSLMNLEDPDFEIDKYNMKVGLLSLWPERPQLYVCYLFEKALDNAETLAET
jgi:SAM-dependent methyltransferase